MSRRTWVAVAVVLVAVAGGCGKSNKVGDESLLNFKDQAQQRLGERTTTTVGATSTTLAGAKAALGQNTPTTQSAAAQQAAAQRQQAQQQAEQNATVSVSVFDDGASGGPSQFDPAATRVYRGAFIKWVNKSSVARSIVSDDGRTFSSPPIAPGASWTWQANTAGSFPYHDGTRPYAVGTVEVVNR